MALEPRVLALLPALCFLAPVSVTRAQERPEASDETDASVSRETTASDAAPTEPRLEIAYQLGRGFHLDSDDEQFGLTVSGRAQVLGELEIPRDGLTGDYADPSLDVSFRRARITFDGHAFGSDTRVKVELAFSNRDMGMRDGRPRYSPFLDAYLDLRQLRDLNLRIGQFKVPFSRERVISSSRLQMVDRSIVNSELNVDRDVGVSLSSRDLFGLGVLRYAAGVFVGEGRDYVPGNGRDNTGFLYTARVEALPLGMFGDYEGGDQARSPEPHLSFGLAYAFLDDAPRNRGILGSAPSDGGTTDYHFVTADAVLMAGGFSAHTEAILRWGSRAPGRAVDENGEQMPVEAARNGIGWMVQLGYLLPMADLEISARYGLTVPLGPAAETSLPERNELGVGLSYYLDSHIYKVQLDAFHLWDSMSTFGGGDERIRLSFQGFI